MVAYTVRHTRVILRGGERNVSCENARRKKNDEKPFGQIAVGGQ
jgi:hypothetical protein